MATAITPYVPRAIRTITPIMAASRAIVRTRARTNAANTIRAAYYASRLARNIRLRSAARKIGRAWRKHKLASRTAPGAKQSTRQFGEYGEGGAVAVQQRTLNVDAIAFPPQGTSVGYRLGTTIRCSGIKICERFINRGQYPVMLHYCLIQPKAPVDDVQGFDWKSEFFRSTIPATDATATTRTENFVDASESPPANQFEYFYDCWPINPDKFNIITHIRKKLSPRDLLGDTAGADTSQIRPRRVGDYMWNFERYYSMKGKRLTFNDGADTVPNQPICRVFWHQALDSDEWNPQQPVPGENPAIKNLLHRHNNTVVYFKNGLN